METPILKLSDYIRQIVENEAQQELESYRVWPDGSVAKLSIIERAGMRGKSFHSEQKEGEDSESTSGD